MTAATRRERVVPSSTKRVLERRVERKWLGAILFGHELCGIRLRSNRPIPGVPAHQPSGLADIVVHLDVVPDWFSEDTLTTNAAPWIGDDDDGSAEIRGWRVREGEWYLLRYSDGTCALFNRGTDTVYLWWPPPLTIEDAATYLLGPVLGVMLRLRGHVCLHAGAVLIGGRAIAFMGDAGAGKSTTVAAFTTRGFPLISDDMLLVHDHAHSFSVVSSYPQVKLWPDAVKSLFGTEDALPRISPTHDTWDKRALELTLDDDRFSRNAVRLGAIYVLQPRLAARVTPAIEPMGARNGLVALVNNGYGSRYLEPQERAHSFAPLVRMASTLPMRLLTPADSLASLPQLCDAVLADAGRLFAGVDG